MGANGRNLGDSGLVQKKLHFNLPFLPQLLKMFRRFFSTLAERQLVIQKGSDFLARHQATIAGLSALFVGIDAGLRNLKTVPAILPNSGLRATQILPE
jgi:hypothetical protein